MQNYNVTFRESTISSNNAHRGAGIYVASGSSYLQLQDTVVSNNTFQQIQYNGNGEMDVTARSIIDMSADTLGFSAQVAGPLRMTNALRCPSGQMLSYERFSSIAAIGPNWEIDAARLAQFPDISSAIGETRRQGCESCPNFPIQPRMNVSTLSATCSSCPVGKFNPFQARVENNQLIAATCARV